MREKILEKLGLVEKSQYEAKKSLVINFYNKIKDQQTQIDKLTLETLDSKEKYNKLRSKYDSVVTEFKKLQKKYRVQIGKIGGLSNSKNKVTKENQDLKNKLKEAMSNKYVLKKIPSGRPPKPPVMKYRGTGRQSKIIKQVKDDN